MSRPVAAPRPGRGRRLAALAAALLALAAGPARPERVPVRVTPAAGGPAFTLTAEVAHTPPQWARGLMGRRRLGPREGMLFLFPEARPRRFWMKECYVALDILFADREGRVVRVVHDAPPCPSVALD
ncbi:MAG: DUF192 domain-containing protein, partial [Nitrospirae bacterium]